MQEILQHIQPDLLFEYMSKRVDFGVDTTGWNIQINSHNELLGEYQNGELISGKWYKAEEEEKDMQFLYNALKTQSMKQNLDFHLFLNKLLCQGKQNDGISWHEYDSLSYIDKIGKI